jgi:hypothetical protein
MVVAGDLTDVDRRPGLQGMAHPDRPLNVVRERSNLAYPILDRLGFAPE